MTGQNMDDYVLNGVLLRSEWIKDVSGIKIQVWVLGLKMLVCLQNEWESKMWCKICPSNI